MAACASASAAAASSVPLPGPPRSTVTGRPASMRRCSAHPAATSSSLATVTLARPPRVPTAFTLLTATPCRSNSSRTAVSTSRSRARLPTASVSVGGCAGPFSRDLAFFLCRRFSFFASWRRLFAAFMADSSDNSATSAALCRCSSAASAALAVSEPSPSRACARSICRRSCATDLPILPRVCCRQRSCSRSYINSPTLRERL
mmetsp:Transcript_46794/g.119379  ORF Transcript_46794/g.119379 Transcript_46794/m.119379 type:complete len:203 (+) Transcript_46794:462-1070(+)